MELADALVSRDAYEALAQRTDRILAMGHRRSPLRPGVPREEVRASLGLAPKRAVALFERLAAEGRVATRGPGLAQPAHVPSPTAVQREAWLRARRALAGSATGSGSGAEAEGVKGVDPEMLAFLAGRGEIVKVGDAVFLPEAVLAFATSIVDELAKSGKVTVARARDITASSRKHVLPLLQFLDDHGLTRRIGDDRVLVHPPGETLARLRSLLPAAGRGEQMERETPV